MRKTLTAPGAFHTPPLLCGGYAQAEPCWDHHVEGAVPFVHDVAVSLKRSIAAGDYVYLVVIGCSPYFLTSNRGASNRRNRADGLPAEHPELLPLLGYGNGSGGSLSLSSQVVALCAPAVPPVAAAKRRSG